MSNQQVLPEPRGIVPYSNGTWGHIDLLENDFGPNWKEAIKTTSHWQRMEAGENLTGNTGSVFWAICVEYKLQND